MKKIIITFTALLMAFAIGCGGSGNANSDKKFNTLALAVAKGDVGQVIFGSGKAGSNPLLSIASIGGTGKRAQCVRGRCNDRRRIEQYHICRQVTSPDQLERQLCQRATVAGPRLI